MESKRSFIKEACSLFNDTKGRRVSGSILTHEWKSSEVWEHFDMLNYRLTDSDKMPSLVWDSGEVFDSNKEAEEFLVNCYISYATTALEHTKKLLVALEEEVNRAKEIKEDLQRFKNIGL